MVKVAFVAASVFDGAGTFLNLNAPAATSPVLRSMMTLISARQNEPAARIRAIVWSSSRIFMAKSLFPGGPPLVPVPTAFVHFNEIEVSDHAAVVFETVFLDHLGDESIGLIIAPAPLAHETVVNENL